MTGIYKLLYQGDSYGRNARVEKASEAFDAATKLGKDPWGGPAIILPNMEECTFEDMVWRISLDVPLLWVDCGRQKFLVPERPGAVMMEYRPGQVTALFMNSERLQGGGFAIVDFNPSQLKKVFTWRKCVHSFKETSGGNCYHIYTCEKCGYRYDVDSSD